MIIFRRQKSGFTLAETMIAVFIGIMILVILANTFSLNQRTFRQASLKAELMQNARVTLDLMAREIRQAKDIVTVLPSDNSNPSLTAHELEFADGHIDTQLQYIRYFLENGALKRQIIAYYFDIDPNTYVHWNDLNAFGLPLKKILEEKVIGENFLQIDFYGQKSITLDLTLKKGAEEIKIKSIITPRNI